MTFNQKDFGCFNNVLVNGCAQSPEYDLSWFNFLHQKNLQFYQPLWNNTNTSALWVEVDDGLIQEINIKSIPFIYKNHKKFFF